MSESIEYEKMKTDNGVTVCYRSLDVPDISLYIAINQGPVYEPLDKIGITHFIEHMMFKSTKNNSSYGVREKAKLLTGREPNALTTHEQILLPYRFPCGNLSEVTNLLYEMTSNKRFDEKEFEKEREVILRELTIVNADEVTDFVTKEVEKIFGNHPYGRIACGTEETISNIDIDDLVEAKENGFVGSNIFITAVGGFNPDHLLDSISSSFGLVQEGTPAVSHYTMEPFKTNEITKSFEGRVNEIAYMTPFPGYRYRECVPGIILDKYLCSGINSRMFTALRDEQQLCYHFGSEMRRHNEAGLQIIYARNFEKKNRNKIIDLIEEELELVKAGVFDEKKLDMIKSGFMMTFYEYFIESIDKQASIISDTESNNKEYDANYLREFYSTFTPDDLSSFAKKYFNEHFLISIES